MKFSQRFAAKQAITFTTTTTTTANNNNYYYYCYYYKNHFLTVLVENFRARQRKLINIHEVQSTLCSKLLRLLLLLLLIIIIIIS